MDFCPGQDRIAAFLSSPSLITKNFPDVTQQTQEDAERWKDKGELPWTSGLGEQHHGEFPGFSFFLCTKLQGGGDTINLETPTGKDQENPPPPILLSVVKDQEKSILSRIENLNLDNTRYTPAKYQRKINDQFVVADA